MSVTCDIADGVVTLLTSAPQGTFAQAFSAARTWLPEQQLETLTGIIVRVIPRTSDESLADRAAVQNDLGVDVVVMSKLTAVNNAAIDPMVGLVDQIKKYLRFRSPATNVSWAAASSNTICSTDSLREFCQFTGTFTLTYRYMEGRA
jgi:citrate lyase beta subunit